MAKHTVYISVIVVVMIAAGVVALILYRASQNPPLDSTGVPAIVIKTTDGKTITIPLEEPVPQPRNVADLFSAEKEYDQWDQQAGDMCRKAEGDEKVRKTFLKDLGNPNRKTSWGKTLLHVAAYEGCVKLMTGMLDKGGDVNIVSEDGNTPLVEAVYGDNLRGDNCKMVELLIARGANVSWRNQSGATALYFAALGSNVNASKLLLEKAANADMTGYEGRTPLLAMVFEQRQSKKVNPNTAKVAELLLAAGANPNLSDKNGETALNYAASSGDANLVEVLLQAGVPADGNKTVGPTPLFRAASSGDMATVLMLLSKGARVDIATPDGDTPLHAAASYGRTEVADLLISKGIKVDVTNKWGQTPLYIAAYNLKKDTVAVLLDKGAQVNVVCSDGATPLSGTAGGLENHFGTNAKREDVVELLIARGADVNAKGGATTPLISAARFDRVATMEILIAKGADLNAKDTKGWTALHWAACYSGRNAVRLLISKGADLNAKDNAGLSVIGASLKPSGGKENDISRMLRDGGARD